MQPHQDSVPAVKPLVADAQVFLTAGYPCSYSGYISKKAEAPWHSAFSLFLIQFSVSAPVQASIYGAVQIWLTQSFHWNNIQKIIIQLFPVQLNGRRWPSHFVQFHKTSLQPSKKITAFLPLLKKATKKPDSKINLTIRQNYSRTTRKQRDTDPFFG